jgi:hypothetical protein
MMISSLISKRELDSDILRQGRIDLAAALRRRAAALSALRTAGVGSPAGRRRHGSDSRILLRYCGGSATPPLK